MNVTAASTSTSSSSSTITTTVSAKTATPTILGMANIPADQLTLRGLDTVLGICFRRRGWTLLPPEIAAEIHYISHGRPNRQLQQYQQVTPTAPEPNRPRGNPYKPPPTEIFTGKTVPIEVRRQILAAWLPAKDVIVQPLCGSGPPQAKDTRRKGKRNKTSDMMTVCKKIKEEMVTCCYEERIFAIHVHEGLTKGGVEAFDAGRQPLQYHTNSHVDDRFTRFGDNDEFGFKKLKKVEITFFPTTEDARFTTVNTYYMSKALAGLLERNGKENRMTSITFKFAKGEAAKDGSDRRHIIARENRWWDPDNSKPRSTALGSMSDIELVLRPFAILDVHNVRVELPPGANFHTDTTQFASTLVARMTGGLFTPSSSIIFGIHDQAEAYMAGKREQLEAEIFERKFGEKSKTIPNVSEEDFAKGEDQGPELFHARMRKKARRIRGTQFNTFRFDEDDDEDDESLSDAEGADEDLSQVRPLIRFRRQRERREARNPQATKRSVFVGPGRTLGSSMSSSTESLPVTRRQPRAESHEELAAMRKFREETGVGPQLAGDWLVRAGWSLSEALKRYNGEQAKPPAYQAPAPTSTSSYWVQPPVATPTTTSTSLPSRAAVVEFCQITGETICEARQYLYGAGGSIEQALSRYYNDTQAERISSEIRP